MSSTYLDDMASGWWIMSIFVGGVILCSILKLSSWLSTWRSAKADPEYRFDVFLSFRGTDVRNKFAAYLYEHLTNKGFSTFMDDKWIERGEEVYPELMDAIRDSRLAIIVFSSAYPTSTWCLREMSAIAKRRRQRKQIVYPVFYDVTASDVGRQKGPYEVHFNPARMSRYPEEADQWKADMMSLSKVSGFPVVDHSNIPETTHLENISCDVAKALKRKSKLITCDLIGIEPRVAELERRLKLTSNDVAFQILEIWGMSGIGKTALANVLYDRISHHFKARCFIQEVKDIHKKNKSMVATTIVQKDILRQMFGQEVNSNDPVEIAKMLRDRLCDRNLPKKVLIVLDDVSDPKQWDDLGIDHSLLGAGSRVVITTRIKHVLTSVSRSYVIYEVPLLNDGEALELFRRKAYNSVSDGVHRDPVDDVSREVIEYAQSLPKAISELGSKLRVISKVDWKTELRRWRKYPDEEYMKELKEKNYKYLSKDEKITFLDIACFLGGKRNKNVEQILESRISSDPHRVIQELLRNSLIKIRNDEIHMHQILRDLGKKIVRGNNTEEPKRWSRLWDAEDFQNVLISDMEKNEVQAIVLDEDVSRLFNIEGLSGMRDLRLLILHQESRSGNHDFGFNALCYLSWHCCFHASLSVSIWFQLVELNLPNSSIQELWGDNQELPNLKRMDLSNSTNLTITPNFERCRGLVWLDLTGCENLILVHDSIRLLSKLDYLSLRSCSSLLIPDFGTNCKLLSLRTLLLFGCNFRHRRPDLRGLPKLSYIDF